MEGCLSLRILILSTSSGPIACIIARPPFLKVCAILPVSSRPLSWDKVSASRRPHKNNWLHLFFSPVLAHRNAGSLVTFNWDEAPNRVGLNHHKRYDLPF